MIAGVILAGGGARRMGGGDKALLEIGGRPILARIVAAIGPDLGALAINANGDPGRFAAFRLPVVPDAPDFAGQGPLAGLAAGLGWASGLGATWLLTAPGDTPFLPSGLVAAMAPPPAFAACDGRDHPLVALWPVACLNVLLAWLGSGADRSVAAFGRAVGGRRVTFPPGAAAGFANVNAPADLDAARAALADRSAGTEPGTV